jgi:hypothetical protein
MSQMQRLKRLLHAFPKKIEEVRETRRFTALLRYRRTGLLIALVLAQHGKDTFGCCWRIETPRSEEKRTAMVKWTGFGSCVIVLR